MVVVVVVVAVVVVVVVAVAVAPLLESVPATRGRIPMPPTAAALGVTIIQDRSIGRTGCKLLRIVRKGRLIGKMMLHFETR